MKKFKKQPKPYGMRKSKIKRMIIVTSHGLASTISRYYTFQELKSQLVYDMENKYMLKAYLKGVKARLKNRCLKR